MRSPYQPPENYIDVLSMNLPEEVKALNAFLLWKLKDPDAPGKKPGKVPYYANGTKRHGTQGSVTDRANLVSFKEAVQAYEGGGYAGVGIAMLKESGLTAIDLDRCFEDGRLKRKFEFLVDPTYAEYSPGLDGVRAIFSGHYPKSQNHEVGLEVFPEGQFVTLTGEALNGNGIAPLTSGVKDQLEKFFKNKKSGKDRNEKLAETLGNDPVYNHLKNAGWITKEIGSDKIGIHCPFADQHTTADGAADCVYFPPYTHGYKNGHFKCLHTYCADRTRDDFLNAIGFSKDRSWKISRRLTWGSQPNHQSIDNKGEQS